VEEAAAVSSRVVHLESEGTAAVAELHPDGLEVGRLGIAHHVKVITVVVHLVAIDTLGVDVACIHSVSGSAGYPNTIMGYLWGHPRRAKTSC